MLYGAQVVNEAKGEPSKQDARQHYTPLDLEQQRLVSALVGIDPKPRECYGCRKKEKLFAYDFALAKPVSTKHAWGGTVASVAISAVTLPLIGYGMLQLPGKRVRVLVLRMRLILCDPCYRKEVSYAAHPWWKTAKQFGYTEFLGPDELDKLQPA